MKTINITQAGAMIQDSKYRIPEMAKAALDNFANNRFKELKYVTKAFKYQFPFYESIQKKRSFNKIFQILDKNLVRMIPYIETSKVKFLSTERDSSENIYVRLGPLTGHSAAIDRTQRVLRRYIARLSRLALIKGLPITVSGTPVTHTRPLNSHRYAGYATEDERAANTFNVYEMRITFRPSSGDNGYLLLFYAPEILKSLETLHRFAHYAESTFRIH